ncbi:MAG: VTT domain-containing protein [Desulforhopalus sp.]
MTKSGENQAAGKTGSVARWHARLNKSGHVMWLLFGLSFLETIILPVPIELVLIPFMLTNRERVWKTAAYVTAGCLVASLFGYGVGYFVFETVGKLIIEIMGWQHGYDKFQTIFDKHGFFAILMVGIIPIPFQVAMLTAGAVEYPIWKFVLAATIARGIRYFGLAWLVHTFGEQTEKLWHRHRYTTIFAFALVIASIWVLAKFLLRNI